MRADRIKGALYGCALGDSLGAITEFSTFQQIEEWFGSELSDYTGCGSFFEKGGILGTVTDDFGSCYYLMKKMLETGGRLDAEIAADIILEWSEDSYYFKFSGPTTKRTVEYIKSVRGGQKREEPGIKGNFAGQTTNGAAMKAVPLGILARGDMEEAVRLAVDMSTPTHYNSQAAAGACAISASVAAALRDDTSLEAIVEAGLYGARAGRRILFEKNRIAMGRNLEYCIRQAVEIGGQCHGYRELIRALDEKIGTGMDVTESVAAVYGILASTGQDCMGAIKAAVNAGGDTDSIACMAGGILGAWQGVQALPEAKIDFMLKQNPGIKIRRVVDAFTAMIARAGTPQGCTIMP